MPVIISMMIAMAQRTMMYSATGDDIRDDSDGVTWAMMKMIVAMV